jgi:hypothetical protein
MAKPRELFNTPAPQAMSQMGAGIADAYANVGRIEGESYAALGQGIAQGITAAAGAYAGYKQQQSQAKSYEGFLKNPLGQKMLGIDAGTADSYIAAAKSMGGAAEQNQFYQMGIPTMMQNTSAMEKMKAEFGFNQQLQGARLGNETALQNARIDAAYNQAWTDAQAKATYGTGAGAALPGFNPNLFSGVGATPQATQGGVMPMPMQTQRPAYNPFNKKRSLTIGGS